MCVSCNFLWSSCILIYSNLFHCSKSSWKIVVFSAYLWNQNVYHCGHSPEVVQSNLHIHIFNISDDLQIMSEICSSQTHFVLVVLYLDWNISVFCLMTLHQLCRLYGTQWMNKWMLNWEGHGGKQSWPLS